ncbi:hypothetical protein PPERSA_00311 [Pseudocohnilembus persalinus]|uniref:Uncharacterized protein n=1 Tax=Pseudocohnilembus persalinus TaxID=266149 RepID=A0A0V0Q901_PSEPJ|nr:hypothetical protein PPERSA_00311 [Pseudocohnilembus persalinus]|eukprot:KRW98723.1 hypothetical protein PPERSA_00311 [Pseudocohnilembus persalinus]
MSEEQHSITILDKHWLEVTDSKHRYGNALKIYYEYWVNSDTKQDFWVWLDGEEGEGKNLSLEEFPREFLERDKVLYLNEDERKQYEIYIEEGKFKYTESKELVDTLKEIEKADEKGKFIFVVSLEKKMYVGPKIRGNFHHSSFLSGAPVIGAGNLQIESGILKAVKPHSGHYRPTAEEFTFFINMLKEWGVSMDSVKIGTIKPPKKKKNKVEQSHTFQKFVQQAQKNKSLNKFFHLSSSSQLEDEEDDVDNNQNRKQLVSVILQQIHQQSPKAQQPQEISSLKQQEEQQNPEKTQFNIPQEFLQIQGIPQFFKRAYMENQKQHQLRIQNYLLVLDQRELSFILARIDPSEKNMKPLVDLVNIVMEIRNAQQIKM